MRKRIALFLLALAAFAPPALADEGSPLLSVDDLLALEDSYEAFLAELGDLAVERGLLSEEDRAAWHDAQLGDFFSERRLRLDSGELSARRARLYARGGHAAEPVRRV